MGGGRHSPEMVEEKGLSKIRPGIMCCVIALSHTLTAQNNSVNQTKCHVTPPRQVCSTYTDMHPACFWARRFIIPGERAIRYHSHLSQWQLQCTAKKNLLQKNLLEARLCKQCVPLKICRIFAALMQLLYSCFLFFTFTLKCFIFLYLEMNII